MNDKVLDLLTKQLKNCNSKEEYQKLASELRELFLLHWSETPDNKETSKYIDLGEVKNKFTQKSESGLVSKSQNALLSEIIWHSFGNTEVPSEVLEKYPSLTKEEWNQILRICQYVLSLFEINKK